MSIKIAHIADVHFRPLSRHAEQRLIFEYFFEKVKELDVDVIYVGGDIYHTKTQGITPEVIDHMAWWFTELSRVAPTHIILGNHDGNLVNPDRQDAISPVIKALDNKNLHLYKQSGTYPTGVPGYNWCVFSVFDEEGWKNVKPVEGEVNIAVYHGCVLGSRTDIGWELEGEIDVDFFKDYDFTMLGDIHKQQFLTPDKRVAYSGSTSQNTYGEDMDKGFLVWEIDDKDNFEVEFHSLPNPHPFVTVDWAGTVSETIKLAKKYPDSSRFRIRCTESIPQIEIKQIHNELKSQKNAKEVVWKFDTAHDARSSEADSTVAQKEDLRDVKVQMNLLKSYAGEEKFNKTQWTEIEKLTNFYARKATQNEAIHRNLKWSIKNLKFDNMFSYGKNNEINFQKLSGITGILGQNRSGKSSIVGTIIYTLFNSTDRGSIKNLHVINSRKGHCEASAHIAINNQDYVIERQSVRREDKYGKQSAVTSVNFYMADAEGNSIKDLNGEQRTHTEKILRKMIGNSEDFLLTSLATQGNMNAFINHGSSTRKKILSKFLDLDIFELMSNSIKEDAAEVRAKLSTYPARDWNATIVNLRQKKKKYDQRIADLEAKLIESRKDQQQIQIELATFSEDDLITPDEFENQKSLYQKLKNEIREIQEKIEYHDTQIKEIEAATESINEVKTRFPIEELKERREALQDLEKALSSLKHQRELGRNTLKNQKKSVKVLDDVPCNDGCPVNKYRKSALRAKKESEKQQEAVDNLSKEIRAISRSIESLKKENLDEKIEKYDLLIEKLNKNQIEISSHRSEKEVAERDYKDLDIKFSDAEKVLQKMTEKTDDNDVSEAVQNLKNMLGDLQTKIQELDAQRLSAAELNGNVQSQIKQLREEKVQYQKTRKRWEMLEFLIKAWSKKGIPMQIIRTQLPVINKEISKILAGVVNFTVTLDANEDTNSAEIYIDYGDSKRIIELGSGMEKMISSLAIRVALLNVSSLPKTNMLIIDEGFGTLDETNVEACNRLLTSLKKWFKNILVITHVDSVKDAVDNTLEITSKGIDSQVKYV